MNFNVQNSKEIKKLKREFIFVYIALLMFTNCIFILTLKVYMSFLAERYFYIKQSMNKYLDYVAELDRRIGEEEKIRFRR